MRLHHFNYLLRELTLSRSSLNASLPFLCLEFNSWKLIKSHIINFQIYHFTNTGGNTDKEVEVCQCLVKLISFKLGVNVCLDLLEVLARKDTNLPLILERN